MEGGLAGNSTKGAFLTLSSQVQLMQWVHFNRRLLIVILHGLEVADNHECWKISGLLMWNRGILASPSDVRNLTFVMRNSFGAFDASHCSREARVGLVFGTC